MAGPEETRLAQGLTGSMPLTVGARAGEWSECAQILLDVATQLGNVSMPIPPGEAGAETATAMNAAFARSADAMRKRAAKLQQGNAALDDSSQVIEQAKAAFEALGPENAAPTHTPHEDPSSPAGIRAENKYNSELAAFHADQERRERISKTHADRMDQVFQRSAATMKEIHGEPDPPPPPPAYSGGGGGVGGGAGFGSGGGYAPGSGGPRTLHPVGTYEPGPGGHGPGRTRGPAAATCPRPASVDRRAARPSTTSPARARSPLVRRAAACTPRPGSARPVRSRAVSAAGCSPVGWPPVASAAVSARSSPTPAPPPAACAASARPVAPVCPAPSAGPVPHLSLPALVRLLRAARPVAVSRVVRARGPVPVARPPVATPRVVEAAQVAAAQVAEVLPVRAPEPLAGPVAPRTTRRAASATSSTPARTGSTTRTPPPA